MRLSRTPKTRLVAEIEELKRKIAELQEAEYLLRIQRDLSLHLSGIERLEDILRLCLETAIRVSGMDSGGIYVAEEATGDWFLAVHSGLSTAFLAQASRYGAGSPNVRAMTSGVPLYSNGQAGDLVSLTAGRKPESIRAFAALPIPFRDRVIACLNVASHVLNEVPAAARLSLETIAGQMGQGIVRARYEEALLRSEKRFRDLTDSLDVGIYRSVPGDGGRFVESNQAHIKMLGWSSLEELRGLRIVDVYESPADRRAFLDILETLGFVHHREIRLRRRNGDLFTASISAVAVRDADGRLAAIDGIVEDVSERKKADEDLETRERTYRALFEQSNDAVLLFSPDGLTIDANRKAIDMLGLPETSLLGSHFLDQIAAAEREDAMRKVRDVLDGSLVPLYERTARRHDGTEFPAEVNLSLVRDPEGRPLFLQSIVRDISERKKSENAMRAALAEKEVLIREIHHRVKNNMQVIISLLRLQARTITDPERREVFSVTQDRIRSMALVHEKLYHSRNLAGIDFKSYIQSLVSHLGNSAGPSSAARVRIELELEDVELNINKAVPCGLILNEWITNAFKYAFPGERTGTIRIRLEAPSPGGVRLTVADDGVGLPETIDPLKPETLGLQIVSDLARQIDAEIGIERRGGTSYTLAF
ncbi:MAG: PAS domain S-box protein [Candidatus Aminicenantales bacterium]